MHHEAEAVATQHDLTPVNPVREGGTELEAELNAKSSKSSHSEAQCVLRNEEGVLSSLEEAPLVSDKAESEDHCEDCLEEPGGDGATQSESPLSVEKPGTAGDAGSTRVTTKATGVREVQSRYLSNKVPSKQRLPSAPRRHSSPAPAQQQLRRAASAERPRSSRLSDRAPAERGPGTRGTAERKSYERAGGIVKRKSTGNYEQSSQGSVGAGLNRKNDRGTISNGVAAAPTRKTGKQVASKFLEDLSRRVSTVEATSARQDSLGPAAQSKQAISQDGPSQGLQQRLKQREALSTLQKQSGHQVSRSSRGTLGDEVSKASSRGRSELGASSTTRAQGHVGDTEQGPSASFPRELVAGPGVAAPSTDGQGGPSDKVQPSPPLASPSSTLLEKHAGLSSHRLISLHTTSIPGSLAASPSPSRSTSPSAKPGSVSAPASPGRGGYSLSGSVRASVVGARGKVGLSPPSKVRGRVRADGGVSSARQLQLLQNRYLQWRFLNAKAKEAMDAQTKAAEASLWAVHKATEELHASNAADRIELQRLLHERKLDQVLAAQAALLEEWAGQADEFAAAMEGTSEALEAASLRVPLIGGTKADVTELKSALAAASEVVSANPAVQAALPKVQETASLLTRLADTVAQEQALIQECYDLLNKAARTEVEERSLRAHLMQVERERQLGRLPSEMLWTQATPRSDDKVLGSRPPMSSLCNN